MVFFRDSNLDKVINLGIGGLKSEEWISGGRVLSAEIPAYTPLVESPTFPAVEAITRSWDLQTPNTEDIEIIVIVSIGHNDILKYDGLSSPTIAEKMAKLCFNRIKRVQEELPGAKLCYIMPPDEGKKREMMLRFNSDMAKHLHNSSIQVVDLEPLEMIPRDVHATFECYLRSFAKFMNLSIK